MGCGWETPEQIAACLYWAGKWLGVGAQIAGVGAFALTSYLVWMGKRLRHDIAKQDAEAQQANQLKRAAEEAARHAEHRAEYSEREAERARKELGDLKVVVTAGSDELRSEMAATKSRLSDASGRLDAALHSTAGGTERFWSRPVGSRFAGYERQLARSIPILLFGNQKGGVGKTTTMTNLAAAFAARGEMVLTVDLDYQGSHSGLMQLQQGASAKEPESLVDYLFEEVLDQNWQKLCLRRLSDNLHYIPAFYNFELVERRIEYQWALGSTNDDVRYRLARVLLSQEVQDTFHRVLIDAPPRFTLGFVNGFCAATHLYVPTVVDSISASAVGSFARQFRELRAIANPRIEWAGIIGTLTSIKPGDKLALPDVAAGAADAAEREAQNHLNTNVPLFIRRPVIVRDAGLARATDTGVAYLNDSKLRPMFDALADVIEGKAPSRRTRS